MIPAEANTRRALITLAALALLYTLHFAKDVLLPITLALVFALLLQPALGFLERCRMPRALAALLLTATLVTLLGGGVWLLSSSALEWVQRLPEAREVISSISSSVQREVAEVDLATQEMAAIAEEITPGDSEGVERVIIQESSFPGDLWATAAEVMVFGGLSVVLLFFLLSSSQQLIERCVQALPGEKDRERALRATAQAKAQMSRYLTTVTVVNLCVGIVTGLLLWALGFPDPALWGAAAAALKFVPFLGAWIMAAMLALVGAISVDQAWVVVAAPLGYMALSTTMAQFVDPLVYGYRFRLNPIIVFVWILFWGWLWGVPGILLAVPLLVLFQVTCQHVGVLAPVALVVGGQVSDSAGRHSWDDDE